MLSIFKSNPLTAWWFDLSLVVGFFGGSLTWTRVCFALVDIPLDIAWARFCSCAGPRVGVWLLVHPTTPTFRLSSAHFLTTLQPSWLATSYNCPPFMMLVWYTINNLSTHLLRCSCGNEHIVTHDTLRDTVATIALKNGTHVQREVSHLFPYYTQQWVDILITRDDFWTLMDVIIVDPIGIDMV